MSGIAESECGVRELATFNSGSGLAAGAAAIVTPA